MIAPEICKPFAIKRCIELPLSDLSCPFCEVADFSLSFGVKSNSIYFRKLHFLYIAKDDLYTSNS